MQLHFAGDGKRKVQVGYVVEAPIWKTSYRLLLDEKEEAVPARVGDGREPDRRGLDRRQDGAGQRAARSASRWTCTTRSTSTDPPSSPNSSPRSDPSRTAAGSRTASNWPSMAPSGDEAASTDRGPTAPRCRWSKGRSPAGMPNDGKDAGSAGAKQAEAHSGDRSVTRTTSTANSRPDEPRHRRQPRRRRGAGRLLPVRRSTTR